MVSLIPMVFAQENEPTLMKEQVKCVFANSDAMQQCYTDDGRFGCSGTGTCVADVSGELARKLTWKSSCDEYGYTTLDGDSEYVEFNCQSTKPPVEVKEQVKCVFANSDEMQQCYTDDGRFGCSGTGTCVTNVNGKQGEKLTWKSSCGGYGYTIIDGNNEYGEFNCQSIEPSVDVKPVDVKEEVKSVSPIFFVQDDGNNTTNSTVEQASTTTGDSITADITPTDEAEIAVMKDNLGAKMRLLQLQKAIVHNALRGELIIDGVAEVNADYDTSAMQNIVDELQLLAEEANNELSEASEKSADVFLQVKAESRTLSADFKSEVYTFLESENMTLKDFRTHVDDVNPEISAEFDAKIKESRNDYQASRVQLMLKKFDVTDKKLIDRVKSGDLSLGHVLSQVKTQIRAVKSDKRVEASAKIKEDKVKRNIFKQEKRQEVKSKLEEKFQARAKARAKVLSKTANRIEDKAQRVEDRAQWLRNKFDLKVKSDIGTRADGMHPIKRKHVRVGAKSNADADLVPIKTDVGVKSDVGVTGGNSE